MSSETASVAGRMEMTHMEFQAACCVMLTELSQNHLCDNRIIHLLCEAVRCSRECCEIAGASESKRTIDAIRTQLASETDRLVKENNYLRGLIPKLTGKCLHCGLEDMSKCASGFPGCDWADDIMVAGDDALKALRTQLEEKESRMEEAARLLGVANPPLPINSLIRPVDWTARRNTLLEQFER